MQKKLLAIVTSLTLVAMLAPPASAMTAAELQAQIAALQAQLATLNSQLNATTTTTVTAAFDANLSLGMRSAKVKALQEFLIGKGYLAAGLNTSYFGAKTKAAVQAYQTAKAVKPASGYFGPLTRAAANADAGVTPSPSPSASATPSPSASATPSTDTVSLGAVPAAAAVAKNAQNVVFLNVKFTADPTGYTVSQIVISRGGVSADADVSAIKLYDGATQIGSSQALNTTTHKATFASLNWQIPANTTKTLAIKANIAATGTVTVGDSITLGLASAADIVSTSPALPGSFPMVSNAMTVAGASVGQLNVDVQTGLVPTATILSGAVAQTMAAWKFTADSTEGFSITRIKVTHIGSATNADIKNVQLQVNGAQIGSTVASLDAQNTATFDLSAAPLVINAGSSKYVYAYADTNSGINTSRSVIFEITQATDVDAFGSNSGGGVTITYSSGTTYSRQTGATMTIGQGTLTTALDAAQNPSAQSYVKGTTNRLFTALKFSTGSREGVRLTQIKLTLAGTSAAATDVSNVTLWNGTTQVAGPGSIVGATVTFGANTIGYDATGLFDIPASSNQTILVKADVPTGANTAHTVSLSVAAAGDVYADGLVSKYDLPAASVTGTATGNAHTIAANGSLTISLASTSPAAQTIVKGATGQTFTVINFTAGTGEDILVSAATIRSYIGSGTGTSTASGDVTNVKLLKADGTQFGSTSASPTASASFSGSLTVSAGNTATLTVVADVPTTTAAASVHFDLPGAGTIATDATSTGVYSTADIVETGSATGNLITVGSGSLTVSAAASPGNQTAILNATGVAYVGLVMTAGSAENIRVSSVKLTRTSSGSGADADFSNIALYNATGTRLTAYKSLASATVTFSASDFLNSLGIDIAKGQQAVVYAKADVPSTATNTDINALGIDVAASVAVTGLTSNTNPTASLTAGPGTSTGVNYKATPAASDLYQATLAASGTLTLATNPDTPITAIQAVGVQNTQGKAGVSFTKLLFTSYNEAANLKSFLVIRGAGSSAADGDFTAVKLYDGTTLVATGYLSGGTVQFNLTADKYINVPKNGQKVLTLVGDLAGVGTAGGATSGDDPKLGIQYNVQTTALGWSASYANKYNVAADGADSKTAVYITAAAALYGNTQIVRQSAPTVAASSLPSTLLSSGTKTLYKWTVTADPMGAVGWRMNAFKFTGSIHTDSTTVKTIGSDDTSNAHSDGIYMITAGDTNNDVKLIDSGTMKVYNSATNTQVAGTFYFRTNTSANAGSYAIFEPTAEEVIAAGTTNTYELRGDLAYGGFTGDAVLVSVPDLAAAVATNTYALIATAAANAWGTSTTIGQSFVWSDRSNTSHALTTADWTNDYKVSGIPMSTLTLSK